MYFAERQQTTHTSLKSLAGKGATFAGASFMLYSYVVSSNVKSVRPCGYSDNDRRGVQDRFGTGRRPLRQPAFNDDDMMMMGGMGGDHHHHRHPFMHEPDMMGMHPYHMEEQFHFGAHPRDRRAASFNNFDNRGPSPRHGGGGRYNDMNNNMMPPPFNDRQRHHGQQPMMW